MKFRVFPPSAKAPLVFKTPFIDLPSFSVRVPPPMLTLATAWAATFMLELPELYREAFVMVVIAELPYKEAAAVLGVQEGTVKSRVFRACQALKTRLWKYAVDRRIASKMAPLQ